MPGLVTDALKLVGAPFVALAWRLPPLRKTRRAINLHQETWSAHNERVAAAQSDAPLWIILGDSAAQAVGGDAYDGGYVGGVRRLLEARDGTPWRMYNLAVSGAKTSDVVAEQIPKLREAIGVFGEPALVTAIAVGNDATFSSVDEWIGHTQEMLPLLPRGTIVASSAGGWSAQRTEKFNGVLLPGADVHGLRVARFDLHIRPPFRGLSYDGFHPNERGYQQWTNAIAAALGFDIEPPATSNATNESGEETD